MKSRKTKGKEKFHEVLSSSYRYFTKEGIDI